MYPIRRIVSNLEYVLLLINFLFILPYFFCKNIWIMQSTEKFETTRVYQFNHILYVCEAI